MIVKKDELDRIIYKKLNDVERFLFKYYEDTNKMKVAIRLISKEQVVDIFDRKRNVIYTSENGINSVNLSSIKIYKNKIQLKLPITIRDEYLEILRFRKNKNSK